MSTDQRVTPEEAVQFRLLGWNPWVGGDPERIGNIMTETQDWSDAWAYNEVRPFYAYLARLARARTLLIFQEKPEPYGAIVSEKGSSALVLNSTVHDLRGRVEVLSRRWKVFSHDRWHFGRRIVIRVVKKDGQRFKIVVVHGPTNGPNGGNRWAFAEFLALVLRIILSTSPGTVILIVGDWNLKREDLVRWLKNPLIARLGLTFDGHNVDFMLARGAKVEARVGKSKRKSDHYPIWYTATVVKKKITKVRAALTKRKKKK